MIFDLSRFGIFAILAFFVEPYVFGAMSVYLGIPGGIWQIPAYIALGAIVLYFSRHNIYDGILAALGIATGVVIYDIIGMTVVEYISQFTSQLSGLLGIAINFFIMGLGLGFISGLVFGIGGVLAAGVTVVAALATVAIIRGGDLVRTAVEGATFGFTKNVPRGYLALTAPFFGLVVVFLPIFVILIMLVAVLAFVFGIIIGAALSGALFGMGTIVAALVAVIYFGLITFLKPHGKSVLDNLIDLLALGFWSATGLHQLLWIVGYAMLLSRFTLREGLYLIGLVTAFVAISPTL